MINPTLSGNASRRDFMKSVTTLTALLGLPAAMAPKLAQAAQDEDKRPAVIWLHFQECTGCSESLLRSDHPGIPELLFDIINLEYQETLMPGAGFQAENALRGAIENNRGSYILVVEGAVPLKENGIYCKIGGKTAQKSLEEATDGALAVVCLGTCASYGGIPAADPNPTGAVSAASLVANKPLINLPGCPPNPYNLPATILYFATFGKLPELDEQNRPLFAYGRRIHDHCERRSHFDAGRFAKAFGDETHKLGYCLYELGCKGPETFANCSVLRFCEGMVWPISIGHPCVGCTEDKVAFHKKISDKAQVYHPASPSWYPPSTVEPQGKPVGAITTLVVGAAAGAAIGYAAGKGKSLPTSTEGGQAHEKH
jgi:hydrogenase small subunit